MDHSDDNRVASRVAGSSGNFKLSKDVGEREGSDGWKSSIGV